MANIPIDPQPFVPPGFQIQHIPGRNTVQRVVLPHRARRHEDWAIVTIHPLPDEVFFQNVREVIEEFLQGAQAEVRDVQECPFGEAYVQFARARDRDRLVRESPHAFEDIFLTFVKHNEGRNWRHTYFNRSVWLLLSGVPFDFWTTEDLTHAISKFGKLIMWERDEIRRGMILIHARVTQLIDIPKGLRWCEGEGFEEDTWSCSVEVLLDNMLGGGPADEDPMPPPNVDPHPLPEHAVNQQGFQPKNNQLVNDEDEEEGWDDDGHWAMPQQEAEVVQQEELVLNNKDHVMQANDSSLSSVISVSDGASVNNVEMELNQLAVLTLPAPDVPPLPVGLGDGLLNLINAYHEDELPIHDPQPVIH